MASQKQLDGGPPKLPSTPHPRFAWTIAALSHPHEFNKMPTRASAKPPETGLFFQMTNSAECRPAHPPRHPRLARFFQMGNSAKYRSAHPPGPQNWVGFFKSRKSPSTSPPLHAENATATSYRRPSHTAVPTYPCKPPPVRVFYKSASL